MIIGAIVWLILCAVVAAWAEKKGHKGIGYLLLSVFLSPLIGGIVVACISNKKLKLCPYCKKAIDKTATVCGNCGRELVKKTKPTDTAASGKEKWIAQRIVELIAAGQNASDAKIQAEAEYSVQQIKQSN